MASETGRDLSASLARVNALSFAAVFGGVLGGSLWLLTLLIVVLGVPHRIGWIGLLEQYFPGYSLSLGGAFAGLVWAFAVGFVLAFPTAWLYYRGVLREIARHPGSVAGGDPLDMVARIGVGHFAAAFGLLCGLAVFLATIWLLVKHRPGEPLGPRLGLLSQFLPGYSVSVIGAIVGLFWISLAGGAAFALTGWIYNRITGAQPGGTR